jgi:hypothetical protein
MLTGRCLCESVRFEIEGRLGPIIYCHCSICPPATGSSLASHSSVQVGNLRIINGPELITEYEFSSGNLLRSARDLPND